MVMSTKAVRNKFLYIASPYSHKDERVRNRRFLEITKIGTKIFQKYGYALFLPITQSVLMSKIGKMHGDWATWKKQDLPALSRCDELWVIKMDGWKESTGVQAEIRFARKHNIPIKYLNPNEV
jgi:hypothetical protein